MVVALAVAVARIAIAEAEVECRSSNGGSGSATVNVAGGYNTWLGKADLHLRVLGENHWLAQDSGAPAFGPLGSWKLSPLENSQEFRWKEKEGSANG